MGVGGLLISPRPQTPHNRRMCDEEKLELKLHDEAEALTPEPTATFAADPRDEVIRRLEQAWIRDVEAPEEMRPAA